MISLSCLVVLTCLLLKPGLGQYLEPRMIGGQPALRGNLPFVSSIKQVDIGVVTKSCLGSLISENFVLTSALCVAGGNPNNVLVEFGTYVHTRVTSDGYNAAEIVVHPQFDPATGKNDVALIRLAKSVYSPTASPVRLGAFPRGNGAALAAVGWNEDLEGGLAVGKPESYRLATLRLNVLEIEECKRRFPEINEHVDFDGTQICTYDGAGKDMCGVDFGGPLIDPATGEQVGIFNDVIFTASGHGHDCHRGHDHPLLFTKVSEYRDWINQVVGTAPN